MIKVLLVDYERFNRNISVMFNDYSVITMIEISIIANIAI